MLELEPTATTSRIDPPRGYPATVATIALMADQAQKGSLHPRIRRRVLELFAGLPSLDVDAEIRAIWDHVLDTVRYMRDPVGAEHITGPWELDRQVDEGLAGEDCESMAVYAAALLGAAGIPSRFEIIGRDASQPRRFTHCSLQVQNPRTKQWVSFDPVGALEFPGFDLGDTVYRHGEPIEHWTLDGKKVQMDLDEYFGPGTYDGDSLLGATLGDAGTPDASTIARNIADTVAQFTTGLGPYGALVATGIKGGEAVADLAMKKDVRAAANQQALDALQGKRPAAAKQETKPAAAAPSSTAAAASGAVGGVLVGLAVKLLLGAF